MLTLLIIHSFPFKDELFMQCNSFVNRFQQFIMGFRSMKSFAVQVVQSHMNAFRFGNFDRRN